MGQEGFISMKQKPFILAWWILELWVITPSSKAGVEREFSVMKLLCIRLRASMQLSTLDILMRIYLCGDSLNDDAFEKIVDIYRDSVADENNNGSQTKSRKISLWKRLTKELIPCYSHTLDLSFFILFYNDSRSFVNLLIRLIFHSICHT